VEMVEEYFLSIIFPYYLIEPNLSVKGIKKLGFSSFCINICSIFGKNYSDIVNKFLNQKDETINLLKKKFGINNFKSKLANAQENLNTFNRNDLIKIGRSLPKDKSHPSLNLDNNDSQILLIKFKDFLSKIKRIFEITSNSALSQMLNLSKHYFSVNLRRISLGKIKILNLLKNLRVWNIIFLNEIELNNSFKIEQYKTSFNTFFNIVLGYSKKIYLRQYNYYKGIANNKGLIFKTSFEDFFNQILCGDKPTSILECELWNGIQGQESIFV
ncbi:unnamed protein product, partial [marine sediment metagenome]